MGENAGDLCFIHYAYSSQFDCSLNLKENTIDILMKTTYLGNKRSSSSISYLRKSKDKRTNK